MTTPKEPRSDGPRLRARARAGTSDALRPEVAAALDGLERSIGQVAASAQGETEGSMRPLDAPPPPPIPVRGPAPEPGDLVLNATVTPASAGPLAAGGLELGLAATAERSNLVDAAPEPDLDLAPLLAKAEQDEGVPAAWAEVPALSARRHAGDPRARRRRNGRILSWAGAVLLVGAAAWLLLPGSSNKTNTGNTTTTDQSTSTTVVTAGSIDGPVFSDATTTTAPAVATPDTTAPAGTTATTVRPRSTTPTTRATPVTTPATVPVTTPPTTAPPPPPTTTTVPPTTTTTCAIGGVPDPQHGTC